MPTRSATVTKAAGSFDSFLRVALQVNPFAYVKRHAIDTTFSDEASYNAAIIEGCQRNGEFVDQPAARQNGPIGEHQQALVLWVCYSEALMGRKRKILRTVKATSDDCTVPPAMPPEAMGQFILDQAERDE